MKNTLFLALGFLALVASGCGSLARHPRTYGVEPQLFVGGYGTTGGYATGMGPGGAGTGGAPLITPPAPVVRGYSSPYSGTELYGTGYTNPEAVRAGDMARESYRSAPMPTVDPTVSIPAYTAPATTARGTTTSTDPLIGEILERLNEHDEQILEDHAAIVEATTH